MFINVLAITVYIGAFTLPMSRSEEERATEKVIGIKLKAINFKYATPSFMIASTSSLSCNRNFKTFSGKK